jgi:4-diphosphocytidyl-2-C-methyl-D-erythritol kinase
MVPFTVESPAKINLMLSVHGPRSDGFHALTSIMVPLAFGDRLRVRLSETGTDLLRCDNADVPTGGDNLILRAAQLFRRVSGAASCFEFDLEKRIPMGAGLGGGSSNAAAALKAMNKLAGEPLTKQTLLKTAAELGSDCPFFIDAVGARVSGRGEVIDVLPVPVRNRLSGQRVALFRPHFGVPTGWAYARLRANGSGAYEQAASAQGRIENFFSGGPLRDLLFNSFEPAVGQKYLALPCLLEELRASGYACLMSGSGSCCFALLENGMAPASLKGACERALGQRAFFIESRLS